MLRILARNYYGFAKDLLRICLGFAKELLRNYKGIPKDVLRVTQELLRIHYGNL